MTKSYWQSRTDKALWWCWHLQSCNGDDSWSAACTCRGIFYRHAPCCQPEDICLVACVVERRKPFPSPPVAVWSCCCVQLVWGLTTSGNTSCQVQLHNLSNHMSEHIIVKQHCKSEHFIYHTKLSNYTAIVRSCLTNMLCFLEDVTKWVDEGSPVDIIYLDFFFKLW